VIGNLVKLKSEAGEPVRYFLTLGNDEVALNPLLGRQLSLHFSGHIHCLACGRATKKSYAQGHCYPCSQCLAACDLCIVRPERCHYAQGTCREPAWALTHCMQAHYVYLANSAGLKVGITRATQVPTRWIDQGAIQALAIFRTAERYQAGLLEVALARHVADKTNWRRLLKGEPPRLDLFAEKQRLLDLCAPDIQALQARFPGALEILLDQAPAAELTYPVQQYPNAVQALNFDKTPHIEGCLHGIKGQYLLLDGGVLNIRKFSGYEIQFTHS
jgi:hypothetical protein